MMGIGLIHSAQTAGQTGGHPVLWALVVVVVSILGMSFVVWLLRGHHRPDDGPGPGGPGGPPPDPPPTPPDPAWWPQFERDLAAYMAGRRPRGERANAP